MTRNISSQPLMRFLKKSLDLAGQILYPPKCLKCNEYILTGRNNSEELARCFCKKCFGRGIDPVTTPYCIKCGIPFHKSYGDNHACETCIKTPFHLDRVRACSEYKGIIKDAIPMFKYQSKLSMAKQFESMMFKSFLKHFSETKIDWILPIPLHRKKLKVREFNQAYLLIRNFPRLYTEKFNSLPHWEIDISSIKRVKMTKPQTAYDIKERKNNLRNAFKIVEPDKIRNKNILLVDDVFTTGATCNEAAKTLLKNGARTVNALVLARA